VRRALDHPVLAARSGHRRVHGEQPGPRLRQELGYRQHAVWLSPDELMAMIGELREVIAPRLANEPSPERGRHLLSPILFPAED
jgi:hypothetical protein